MKNLSTYRVNADAPVKLKKIPTDSTGGYKDANAAAEALEKHRKRLEKLQEVLYAGATNGVLIVLQGMDTSGKDGTIRSIFSGVNPQGCSVQAFKVPTPLEAKHDFLWRIHAAVPQRGQIGIFNRSHYEDVLYPAVHHQISDKEAKRRFRDIQTFETMLSENGITVLKFFLHISVEEQGRRLQARLDDKHKHWKISAGDFAERKLWPKYQEAYEGIFAHTGTAAAPWYIIPADHKWHRNVAISSVIVEAISALKLTYPQSTVDLSKLQV